MTEQGSIAPAALPMPGVPARALALVAAVALATFVGWVGASELAQQLARLREVALPFDARLLGAAVGLLLGALAGTLLAPRLKLSRMVGLGVALACLGAAALLA